MYHKMKVNLLFIQLLMKTVSPVHQAISKFTTDTPPPWQAISSSCPKTLAPNPGQGTSYALSFTVLTMDPEIQGLHPLLRIRKHWDDTYLLLQVF